MKRDALCGLIVLAMSCGCGTHSDGKTNAGDMRGSEPETDATELDFYDLIRSGADYDPVTAAEAVAAADLIVVGRVVDVAEGRIFRTELRTETRDLALMVVVVETTRVLKGTVSDNRAYFEWSRGSDLEFLRGRLPQEDVLVLLTPSPTPTDVPEGTTILNVGKGYPEGVPERTIQTPQLWLTEQEEGVVSPLEPDRSVIFEGGTLAEVADEVEQLTSD